MGHGIGRFETSGEKLGTRDQLFFFALETGNERFGSGKEGFDRGLEFFG